MPVVRLHGRGATPEIALARYAEYLAFSVLNARKDKNSG